MTDDSFIMKGRCWPFGDDVANGGDMMPLRFALSRETDPETLKEHAMTGIDAMFPRKARQGDIIVAGKRFAQGNPHIQSFIGLRGLSLGLAVESIPRGSFRNAINAGVPILPSCPGISREVEAGDEIAVNFATGLFRNISRGIEKSYEPLPSVLLNIVRLGGWEGYFRQRLAARGASELDR